jgi:hypothetical protein
MKKEIMQKLRKYIDNRLTTLENEIEKYRQSGDNLGESVMIAKRGELLRIEDYLNDLN